MKNMKVRVKLIFSFAILLALMLVVSIISIVGLSAVNSGADRMYSVNLLGTQKGYDLLNTLTYQRSLYRECVLAVDPAYKITPEQAVAELRSSEEDMQKLMNDYESWSKNPETLKAFGEFKKIYESTFMSGKEGIVKCALVNDTEGAYEYLVQMPAMYKEMASYLHKIVEINDSAADASASDNRSTFSLQLTLQIIIVVIAIGIIVFITIYLATLIAKPLRFVADTLKGMSDTGQIELSPDQSSICKVYEVRKDEIGEMSHAVISLIDMLNRKVGTLSAVSDGDLTTEIERQSPNDTISIGLQKMTDNLNDMFSEINSASNEVSIGSKQVADGSQALAQGSTEQAAAVEQLSASISSVASKTSQNAELAREASGLSADIKASAEKGSVQMQQMMDAVREINEASHSIEKVIKVIDDIAFQTNILALNAAVEAARAGQHGKGFAVVAEEVRNLAAKSADAAKDTGGMIANSIEKAKLGYQIATETSESLSAIVNGINRSTDLVHEISVSSDEQSMAISQINTGIDQVAQVVQQNSATAEQSAASAEEMSSQSALLLDLISRFKIKSQSSGSSSSYSPSRNIPSSPPPRQLMMPQRPQTDSYNEFGKY